MSAERELKLALVFALIRNISAFHFYSLMNFLLTRFYNKCHFYLLISISTKALTKETSANFKV